MELTRFCGYLTRWRGGVHDVKIKDALSAGVPVTNDRVGPFGGTDKLSNIKSQWCDGNNIKSVQTPSISI